MSVSGGNCLASCVLHFISSPFLLSCPIRHPLRTKKFYSKWTKSSSFNLPAINLSVQPLLLFFAEPPKPKASSQLPCALSLSTFALTTRTGQRRAAAPSLSSHGEAFFQELTLRTNALLYFFRAALPTLASLLCVRYFNPYRSAGRRVWLFSITAEAMQPRTCPRDDT